MMNPWQLQADLSSDLDEINQVNHKVSDYKLVFMTANGETYEINSVILDTANQVLIISETEA